MSKSLKKSLSFLRINLGLSREVLSDAYQPLSGKGAFRIGDQLQGFMSALPQYQYSAYRYCGVKPQGIVSPARQTIS